MKTLVVFLFFVVVMTAAAQSVHPVLFFGPGISSSLASGAKSTSAIAGGKVLVILGKGWFGQLAFSGSYVEPLAATAKGYWSIRPSTALGYRLHGGKSRFALYAGPGWGRNRVGDFVPTVCGGLSVRLMGRWALVTDVSRNSQAQGASSTLGYTW